MLTGRRIRRHARSHRLPSMRMRPLSGVSNPAISRSNVVLPQPEGPSSAKNSPRSTISDTRSTAGDGAEPLAAPGRFRAAPSRRLSSPT